ncbi:hypothetical protein TNCV_5064841 [Trichonephila clavipes]|nr:hypothetical protein TNCV_5064841 [Trichonephila clavipes]
MAYVLRFCNNLKKNRIDPKKGKLEVAELYEAEKVILKEIQLETLAEEKQIKLNTMKLLDIMIVQFRNEKVSNHGSIPITIDCNVVAFIVFEEGFHQPIKRTKQSALDVTVFRHTLVD